MCNVTVAAVRGAVRSSGWVDSGDGQRPLRFGLMVLWVGGGGRSMAMVPGVLWDGRKGTVGCAASGA